MTSAKKTVLLVDDDEDLLEQLRVVIAKEFATDSAYSGDEALKKVAEKNYDAIVMDVMMQSLSDGLDTAKKLKEDVKTSDIPIVMLTSVNKHYDYRSQIDESYFPNDKWLDKPVDPAELMRELKKLIK